jgi:putative peptidoglycan lipid II flippase
VALVTHVWHPKQPTAIYSVAIGVLVGGILRFLVQVPGLASKLKLFRASLDLSTPGVRTVLGLMPPVVVGLAFATARTWADSRFGTDIAPGAYTCLDYARKIPDFTLQVLPLAVSFVVYPFLSEWAMRGEKEKLADALIATTRALAFVFIPVSVGLMALSAPVINLVYKHGAFGDEGAMWSSMALFCYAPGLFFFSLDASLNHWYFALKDTRTPNYVGAACATLHVIIAYVGVYHLGGTTKALAGIATVALALTISKTSKIIILYALIRKRIGHIDRKKVAAFAAKLALCAAVMGVLMWVTNAAMAPRLAQVGPLVQSVKKRALVELVIGFTVGGVAFLVAAAVLRIEELQLVLAHATAKVRGKLGRGRPKTGGANGGE